MASSPVVKFSNVNFQSRTGPNTFAQRLVLELSQLGWTVINDHCHSQRPDVVLAFIEPVTPVHDGVPVVQRLDGIWTKQEQFDAGMNDRILKTYFEAKDVIWQSDFDRKVTTRLFGSRPGHVIRNGISLARNLEFPDALVNLRNQYEKMFVCSANWHPQKRLKDNLELFQKVRHQFSSACLLILGSNPDVRIADPHVFYTGNIDHQLCLAVYATVDWMIHLAWLDHCPNVVVEALSQNTPIICTDSGGTHEIVRDNGIVIPENVSYDFGVVDYDSPPPINIPSSLDLSKRNVNAHYLDISEVAKQYDAVLKAAIA
jgi:glycosyltransferase involved in cell wall biosynthesis